MSMSAAPDDGADSHQWPNQVRVLLECAVDIVSEHDLEAILRRIVEGAAEVVGAKYAALGIYGSDGEITSFVYHGIDAELANRIGELPHGKGLLGNVNMTAKPIRLKNLSTDTRSCGFPIHHPPMKSFLGAPVGRGGRRFGNLYLTEKLGESSFSAEDEALIMVLATFAASAIESAEFVSSERSRADTLARLVIAEESERVRRGSLAAVIAAQESERARVARDLHDDIGQALTSVLLGLRLIESSTGFDTGDDSERRSRIDELRLLVANALQRTRQLAFELRPTVLDDVGLAPALERLVADVAKRSGLVADVIVDSVPNQKELSSEISTVVYRVVQEALTNVVRHSQASSVSVAVTTFAGHLRALIEDDGIGFDSERHVSGHLGLQGMKERAELVGGTVRIVSEPNSGTTVVLEIPIV